MNHFTLVTLHLFAALIFVGTVFFEVLMLEGVRSKVPREAMRAVERAIGARARQLMPFVLLVLYGAGLGMAWEFRSALARPFDSVFGTLLTLKIVLAFSVLGHFIYAAPRAAKGSLRGRASRFIHISVFLHMVAIVFLAKAMFYIR